MKTVILTESQKKKIKKAVAAQDQVGGKVNAGVMDAVAYGGGMCEEKEPIQEAAVDLEYHYTSLRNLISMMRTDTFNLSDNTDKFLKEPGRKGDYFMSLTRMRNSAEGYGKGIINSDESPVIRIELDGRKLNMIRNVNIHPYDYFYNNWDGGLGMAHVVRGRSIGDSYTAEAEDSLTLKNGKDQIVEYVDVTKEQLELKDENGIGVIKCTFLLIQWILIINETKSQNQKYTACIMNKQSKHLVKTLRTIHTNLVRKRDKFHHIITL